ncbi:MAG TPA: phosphate ABC transporter permease subunit PstC [Candidatus Limnocylindria bacterium]|nr:phosphate ABC transporter permease subunit PstC [Candidatus Limnocylindria bacterium]
MRGLFLASACVCILAVGAICAFLFVNGLPFFAKYSPIAFVSGTEWAPLRGVFGILPMIVGSFVVTFGALLFGAPVGVLTAILMARFAPAPVVRAMKPAVALLAGIPSVVFGFFGMMLLVPFVRNTFGGTGKSVLVASLLLGIMILPTVIQTSLAALGAVPRGYYEGSLALGATHEGSVFRAVVPAARPGIVSGLVLGVARAIGETTAVIMVAGNNPRLPTGVLNGVRTLTTNVLMEMGYAADLHAESLVATGLVLFVIVLAVNFLFSFFNRRRVVQ